MTYAFDPELRPWVEMLPKIDIANLDLAALRSGGIPQLFTQHTYEPTQPLEIRNLTIPGPDGGPDVPVRVYAPAEHGGDLPGLVYIHGGGFILGSLDQVDPLGQRLADQLSMVVVSVDYRLAPENRFPAGLEDCYAALLWTAAKAADLGIDPTRLGVGGDSAGGGLAAATALLARDRGGPAIKAQILGVPELDDRLTTPSMVAYTDTPLWNRPNATASWRFYLPEEVEPGGDAVSEYARARPRQGSFRAASGLRQRLRIRSAARRRHDLRATARTSRGRHRAASLPGHFPRLRDDRRRHDQQADGRRHHRVLPPRTLNMNQGGTIGGQGVRDVLGEVAGRHRVAPQRLA